MQQMKDSKAYQKANIHHDHEHIEAWICSWIVYTRHEETRMLISRGQRSAPPQVAHEESVIYKCDLELSLTPTLLEISLSTLPVVQASFPTRVLTKRISATHEENLLAIMI